MRYRKLTASGDYSFGRGQADFYRDVPEAPAQAVKTRLHLETGEFFLDQREGTPWSTDVLGNRTAATRDIVILTRALATVGVKSILSYSSQVDRDTRKFSVQMALDTIYGPATLVEPL